MIINAGFKSPSSFFPWQKELFVRVISKLVASVLVMNSISSLASSWSSLTHLPRPQLLGLVRHIWSSCLQRNIDLQLSTYPENSFLSILDSRGDYFSFVTGFRSLIYTANKKNPSLLIQAAKPLLSWKNLSGWLPIICPRYFGLAYRSSSIL